MSALMTSPAPGNPAQTDKAPQMVPLLQPDQMEGMFGGLDKMADALPMEKKQQMEQLLATSTDPEEEKAGWANVAFLADRYGKDPQEIAQNADAYRDDYAHQMFKQDGPVDDKAFYGLVGQHFQKQRDERGLLAEGMGKLFDAFRTGEGDWKGSFGKALAEMRGKPGFDVDRLDLYRHLAQTQWQQWQDMGEHYPAAMEDISAYLKQVRTGKTSWNHSPAEMTKQQEIRGKALSALRTIPEHDQDAVLGLAMRGLPGKDEDKSFAAKAGNRINEGTAGLVKKGAQGLVDLASATIPGGLGFAAGRQAMRKDERKLDLAVSGTVDPNTSTNWLGKGVLGAAEGLPSMLAMFTPAGVAINLGAFSEEARGHFEDAGVPADKAAILGPLAGVALTALQTVNSQVLMGKGVSAGVENWMAGNLAGKAGSALIKGYAKNVLAMGAIDTATLGTITVGQQLTEPALQSMAAQLDKTIPQIQWTGPKGEWRMLAKATPETLASLVPLIVLGTGTGVLRNRAYARNTVSNEKALSAIGLKPEAVKAVMEAKGTESKVIELQQAFEHREPNPAAVEAMNEAQPTPKDNVVTLAPDGTYLVKDETGAVVDQAATAEMAAKAVKEIDNPPESEAMTNEEIEQMHKEHLANMGEQNAGEVNLRDWIKGKLPHPETAQAGGEALSGELKMLRDHFAVEAKDGKINYGKANQYFAKKGEYKSLDDLTQAAREAGFNFATPAELVAAVDGAFRGDEMFSQRGSTEDSVDLSGEGLGTERPEAMRYGITNPAMARAMHWIAGAGDVVKNIWREARSLPAFDKFHQILNDFNSEQQRRSFNLAKEVRQVFDAVPDKLTRRAMYRVIEANFDAKTLKDWAAGSTRKTSKEAYEAALKLTPEQTAYAKKIKQWFEEKHPQAVEAGLLDPEKKRKDYVPLMVDKPYEVKALPSQYGGKMKGDFSHAITREFKNSFELENATDDSGDNLYLKLKTDDLPEVMAAYGSELDKVDLTRQALKALESAKAKASDGEPLVQGVHGVLTNKPDKGSTISNPSAVVSEAGVKYETLDHPAFKRFYFGGTDLEGKPVMFKGEMGLHPEIYQHMANILGKSKLQNWMDSPGGAAAHLAKTALRAFQESQKFVKANMFSLSVFHATHIGTRAAGNMVAPWQLEKVDLNRPDAQNAMQLGLQLGGDNAAMSAVAEGLGGGAGYNVLGHVPGVKEVVNGVTHLTFHEIIPAYKLATWKALNARNLELFAKDIKAGRVTKDQVGYNTSHQVNARFGEQNYTDLGSNPTFRHVLSLLTLAPDFWRSNIQNYAQVAAGATGAKVGREPLKAFVLTAGVTWLSAHILSKALSEDDDWHFEDPFAVHAGKRTYTFRTEVNDLERIVKTPNQYLMGRLSPFASSALEWLSSTNWRGEKVDTADVLKEAATKAIPSSLKFLPGVAAADEWGQGRRSPTSHLEQLLTSQGIQVRRASPLMPAYELARDYKKAIGKEDKAGTYPVSKFQQLRYALEDGDSDKAKQELATLAKTDNPAKLSKSFHSSLFHPWTGTHKSDLEFKATLGKDDLAKVEKAEAHRRAIWADFQKLHSDHNPEPAEEP